jgi:microcystin degradation protein MlrC
MKRRAVIAMMQHETNTFSPVPTPIARFGTPELPMGPMIFDMFKGTGTALGAFLDLADAAGMEMTTPIVGNAAPSGPVESKAYSFMSDAICAAVERGCDVCFLDLHGAMVTEDTEDGEGALLKRIRAIAPDLPIAVSLDLHANITDDIVDNCTAIVGYKTYPHIDMYETGAHVGRIVMRALEREIDPVMRWDRRPLLAQTLRMGHEDAPMGPLIDAARRLEADGLLAASVFGGFPLADIWSAGLSVVTIADRKAEDAEQACQQLASAAWQVRDDFLFKSEPLEATIARAKTISEGPVILLDHADNSASGGTQDTTHVLAEVLRQGLEDVAMFAVCDPQAVEQLVEAGVGNEVTFSLGGRHDMPSIRRSGEPLTVTGKVRAVTDGNFEITVPMGAGTFMSMGRCAVLDTGNVQIIVISRHTEPYDLGVFRSLGIEPTRKRYLILKSRIHYRAGFREIAAHELPCDGVGVTSSDNALFEFKNVRRPIFPLDPDTPERPNHQPPTI